MTIEQHFPSYLSKWMGFTFGKLGELAKVIYSSSLHQIGITPHHLGVLMALDNHGPQVQARLTDLVSIDKATMVTLIRELGDMDCIEKVPHPTDKRAHQVTITDKGIETVKEAERISIEVTDRFFEALNDEEKYAFHDMLQKLTKTATDMYNEIEEAELKR
ncbi:MarR family transcriptional regulator [Bacillus sp. CGMCC 1.16541]|uniref:MarR family winged helix-turn-helix transcriptional regulator n=1 Tax=Bacillus sp. CGMCC 1.16541 TaxID=2185143 RepID=UPI0013A577C3|nr:MarR family transcriptional regulator [Bacillus sp. CGMCC 1.16541]